MRQQACCLIYATRQIIFTHSFSFYLYFMYLFFFNYIFWLQIFVQYIVIYEFHKLHKTNQRIKFWKIYLNFQQEKILFAENVSIIKASSISFCQLKFPDSFM